MKTDKIKLIFLVLITVISFTSCKEKKEFARDSLKSKTAFTIGKLNDSIYTNSYFGFEIEYPNVQSWIQTMYYDKDDDFYTSDKTRTLYPLYALMRTSNATIQIWAEKPKSKDLLSPMKYALSLKEKPQKSDDQIEFSSPTESVFANRNFIKLESKNITKKGNATYYIASKGDYLFYIILTSYTEADVKAIEKVLETLKFK